MVLSAATALYVGTTSYSKAYIGETQVWPAHTGYTFSFTYTSGTGGVIAPYTSSTEWIVVSNTYSGGRGTIVVSASTSVMPDEWMYDREYLKSINIPSGITKIGKKCFAVRTFWTGLSAVTMPNTVATIDEGAFYATGLKSVTIPNSVTFIGKEGFYSNTKMTALTLSNTLTALNNSVFDSCSGITSLTIPKSVTKLERSCLGYCTKLTTLNYTGTKAQWQAIEKWTEGYSWNYSVPATVVHCSDGDVQL